MQGSVEAALPARGYHAQKMRERERERERERGKDTEIEEAHNGWSKNGVISGSQ